MATLLPYEGGVAFHAIRLGTVAQTHMTLNIHTRWLPDGATPSAEETAEDCATLGEVEIVAAGTPLTEAVDARTAKVRRGANLSTYQLAQWLAWHWWRLRWETRSPARQHRTVAPRDQELNWHAAHNLGELGDGWLWPMVIFESDGVGMAMRAEPTSATPAEPLRFLGSPAVVVPIGDWERGVDNFLGCVLDRLADCGLMDTDLATMWQELTDERADPELAVYRKIEARLGFDVDEADPKAIERIHKAGASLGHAAMLEVAADGPAVIGDFTGTAREFGFLGALPIAPMQSRGWTMESARSRGRWASTLLSTCENARGLAVVQCPTAVWLDYAHSRRKHLHVSPRARQWPSRSNNAAKTESCCAPSGRPAADSRQLGCSAMRWWWMRVSGCARPPRRPPIGKRCSGRSRPSSFAPSRV